MREGASQFARNKCRTPRKNLLDNAKDWEIAADLERLRHYPQVLRESGKRPDDVIVSASTYTFILVEMTFPWENRIGISKCLKEDRYSELALDLKDKGYKV